LGGVFKMQPNGDGYQFLPTGSGGAQWYRSVAESGDGFLYGAHPGGGTQFNGLLFRVRPDGSDLQTLHEFSETAEPPTGVRPKQLLHASDGHLYGISFQRSPTPIHSVTVFTPILLRLGPVPLPDSSGAPLVLTSGLTASGPDLAFRIAFTGEAGKTYTLQAADALPPLWLKAGEAVAGSQGAVEFSEAVPADGTARYFRVMAE
ncbi:MAG: hypothetical protein J0L84_18700, partial [Verrucomicrobia bacterium]|nr:hypothetical protein [Verrucomicrobiota bacterium]